MSESNTNATTEMSDLQQQEDDTPTAETPTPNERTRDTDGDELGLLSSSLVRPSQTYPADRAAPTPQEIKDGLTDRRHFHALIHHIAAEINPEITFAEKALDTIQEVVEEHVISVLKLYAENAAHAKRKMILERDVWLAKMMLPTEMRWLLSNGGIAGGCGDGGRRGEEVEVEAGGKMPKN